MSGESVCLHLSSSTHEHLELLSELVSTADNVIHNLELNF